ncbi:MAG: glycosyltransferase family 39 protein, partial [Myxococcales bacterium]|nr:glycosyltransferase family 39 protein [Myxococcales bacterium]
MMLYGLGGGALQPYDEGLYGKLARNALVYGQYLHAVGVDGQLYEGFEKPPLSIMAVAASFGTLGFSLTALRLPFALCSIASIGVAFAWGRRIGGLPFGVAWAGALLFCEATLRWGRTASIEPMLMLFVLTGLWAYHEALLRQGRAKWAWTLVAAGALVLAAATKQVLVGLAMAPIVALELWRWRGREALPRLALVVGLPVVVGLAWLWLLATRVGDVAFDIYFASGVVERLEGYRSGWALRTLNELAGAVAETSQPFPWVLGVAGLVVLVLRQPAARREASGALLLPLLLVTTVLVFDNLSDSMRPWYAYDLIVPLTGGVGFLVAGLAPSDPPVGPGLGPAPPRDRLATAHAAAGALTLAVGAVGALADVISELDAALLAGLLVIVAWRSSARPAVRRGARLALLGAAALAFVVGTAVRRELHTPPGGHEQLMERFAARGIERVHVDTDTQIIGQNAWGTYYGPHAQWITRPPWRTHAQDAQAYVTGVIWPTELHPIDGVEILHAPGVSAVVGRLDRAPWGISAMRELLEQPGHLTFEAEHLPSQREDVVRTDPQASGGLAVAAGARPVGRPRAPFMLSHGPGIRLERGRYVADFMVRIHCAGRVER